jgi:hypothetical protein
MRTSSVGKPDGEIILKDILRKQDWKVWIGSIWLRIGTEHANEPSRSIKARVQQLAERMSTSQDLLFTLLV